VKRAANPIRGEMAIDIYYFVDNLSKRAGQQDREQKTLFPKTTWSRTDRQTD
jgi:hypothetical protein